MDQVCLETTVSNPPSIGKRYKNIQSSASVENSYNTNDSPIITESRSQSRLLRKNVSFHGSSITLSEGKVKQVQETPRKTPSNKVKTDSNDIRNGKTTNISCHKITTPNFKRIHEKAFLGMESIKEYHHRVVDSHKKNTSALKKTPAKKYVSRVPTMKSDGRNIKPSFSEKTSRTGQMSNKANNSRVFYFNAVSDSKSQQETAKENINSKKKFDLKASLARRLNYTPYKGPVKPLRETQTEVSRLTDKKLPSDRIRSEKREMLKNVRKNKRFELQMKTRI